MNVIRELRAFALFVPHTASLRLQLLTVPQIFGGKRSIVPPKFVTTLTLRLIRGGVLVWATHSWSKGGWGGILLPRTFDYLPMAVVMTLPNWKCNSQLPSIS